MPGIYRLKGIVKHYDWGGDHFIPSLLKQDNSNHQPFAEYWMGTHHGGEARVEFAPGDFQNLSTITGDLPFLFKVLDVKKMLSIQVHPAKEAAAAAYARENEAGIEPHAPHRNYRDENHKPELMVALSDFWLLHGFKPTEEMVYTLLNVVELRELLPVFNEKGYAGLYKFVMEMPQEEVNRILRPLLDNLAAVYHETPPEKNDEDFWAARAAAQFNRGEQVDRGIFSIYLFNLVHLKKGEGIFQDAGVPHAYLEGQNVEIMANSDNVLRGGLTTKHIDVPELLKHVRCEATYPEILSGDAIPIEAGEETLQRVFPTTAVEFQLHALELHGGDTVSFKTTGHEVILVTEGRAELDDDAITLSLQPGDPCAYIVPGQQVYLAAATDCLVFRATVPV